MLTICLKIPFLMIKMLQFCFKTECTEQYLQLVKIIYFNDNYYHNFFMNITFLEKICIATKLAGSI